MKILNKLLIVTLVGLAFYSSALFISKDAWSVEPIRMRWASDHGGPPHPCAIAEAYFADQVEKRIPGSKVQIYWAGSLYNVPQATEALTEGNLEMMTGQIGKTVSIDPFMAAAVGPQLLTTPGAINALDGFETFAMLKKRAKDIHDIKIFGSGHLSMYMGAGAIKSRIIKPEDFAGQKIRSMSTIENSLLKALGANPVTMAFGDVPSALQTGVIDGLFTSLGGFNQVKSQAPYFTVAGINGIVGDYYWFGASGKWWRKLSKEQQEVMEDKDYYEANRQKVDKRMAVLHKSASPQGWRQMPAPPRSSPVNTGFADYWGQVVAARARSQYAAPVCPLPGQECFRN